MKLTTYSYAIHPRRRPDYLLEKTVLAYAFVSSCSLVWFSDLSEENTVFPDTIHVSVQLGKYESAYDDCRSL